MNLRRERGAAAVEFALVALPLLLVMVAIVSLGVVFNQQLAVTAAAREGVRYYTVNQATQPSAQNVAEGIAASMVSNPVTFTWTLCAPTSDTAELIVTTNIDAPIGGFEELLGLTDLNLQGVGSMRCGG